MDTLDTCCCITLNLDAQISAVITSASTCFFNSQQAQTAHLPSAELPHLITYISNSLLSSQSYFLYIVLTRSDRVPRQPILKKPQTSVTVEAYRAWSKSVLKSCLKIRIATCTKSCGNYTVSYREMDIPTSDQTASIPIDKFNPKSLSCTNKYFNIQRFIDFLYNYILHHPEHPFIQNRAGVPIFKQSHTMHSLHFDLDYR